MALLALMEKTATFCYFPEKYAYLCAIKERIEKIECKV
jgi:hypothetical protein